MRLRHATLKDAPLLAKLNYQLIRDLGLPHLMTVKAMTRRMKTWLATDHRAALFEKADAEVAYALYRETPEEIYLRQFLVVRNHRRHGVGRRALRQLRSRVWPKTKRLTLEVLVSNQPAIIFWRKMGFDDHTLKMELLPARRGRKEKENPQIY